MLANVGSVDRVIRFILGLVLIAVAFLPGLNLVSMPILQWGAVIVGVILIGTALMRFCPLYRLFGLSTRKVSN